MQSAYVLVIVNLFLSACFNPTIPEGLRCDTDTSCPENQRCDAIEYLCRIPSALRIGSGGDRPNPDRRLPFWAVQPDTPVDNQSGYAVVGSGRLFRFTWNGSGEFRGSLFADQQRLIRVSPACADWGGNCARGKAPVDLFYGNNDRDRVDFSARSSGHAYGIEIEIANAELGVMVDLLVNGVRAPMLVFFGSSVTTPPGALSVPSAMPCGFFAVPPP